MAGRLSSVECHQPCLRSIVTMSGEVISGPIMRALRVSVSGQ